MARGGEPVRTAVSGITGKYGNTGIRENTGKYRLLSGQQARDPNRVKGVDAEEVARSFRAGAVPQANAGYFRGWREGPIQTPIIE